MENHGLKRLVILSLLFATFGYDKTLFAANTQTFINNVSGLGNAFAATAVVTDDASVQYYNPAGLSYITQQQIVLGAVLANQTKEFVGTTNFFPTHVMQSGSASAHAFSEIPFFYYSLPINDQFTFGFGFSAFGGTGQNFSDYSILRYTSTKELIAIADIGPALAYKIVDQVSIGLGLDVDYLFTKLNVMAPTGGPGSPDAKVLNNAGNFGYGWHAGIIYAFRPDTKIGLAYRSQIIIRPTGTSTYLLQGRVKEAFITSDYHFANKLAPATTVSLSHQFDRHWTLMGGFDFTQWGVINSVTISNVASPLGPITAKQILNYRNTWRLSAAVNYQTDGKWLLRTGVYYDQDPTNHNHLQADNVPSPDFFFFAVGARYQAHKCFSIDMGYARAVIQDTNIGIRTNLFAQNGILHTTDSNELGVQFNFGI